MKSNELRLGNQLKQGTVTAIMVDRVVCYLDEANNIPYDLLEPIPLMEEWLLKFGFENMGAYFKGLKQGFIISKDERGFYLCDIDLTVIIKHVHQLQNLYFALTNEEL